MNTPKEAQLRAILSAAHLDYAKALGVHSYYKVPDRNVSEDLVQMTFMKTWSYLVRGGKIDLMKAFLYHILNDLIVDEYRKRKTISLDSMMEHGFQPKGYNAERFLNFLDGKRALLLINRLPTAYQKIMRMRYCQDLSLPEIAKLTGQSKNAVAVRLHRGLKKIRLLYKI